MQRIVKEYGADPAAKDGPDWASFLLYPPALAKDRYLLFPGIVRLDMKTGEVAVKESLLPDGSRRIKAEHRDLSRIARESGSLTAVSNMSPRPGENPVDGRGLPRTNRRL